MIPVPVERVLEIIDQNKKGIIVEQLSENKEVAIKKEVGYMNPVGQESLTRFDGQKKRSKGSSQRRKNRKGKNNK